MVQHSGEKQRSGKRGWSVWKEIQLLGTTYHIDAVLRQFFNLLKPLFNQDLKVLIVFFLKSPQISTLLNIRDQTDELVQTKTHL